MSNLWHFKTNIKAPDIFNVNICTSWKKSYSISLKRNNHHLLIIFRSFEVMLQNDCDEPKKPKLEETKAKTCAHFLKRKKRYCKMTVAKGRNYCGEHEPIKSLELSANESPNDRIPCPLDSKHTVYRKGLTKHLKICNARPKDDEPSYIQKGINAGDIEKDTEDCNNLRLGDLNAQELHEVIKKVEQIYTRYIEGKIESSTAHNCCLDDELAKTEYSKETRKHLLQAAALLGILEQEAQLQDATSYIEFGAGKGQLAFYLAQILKERKDSQVILLDRMSLRHKKDNKVENRSLVHRIRVDIADFHIAGLDLLVNSKHIVAISKHLCGAATDLTLRCITHENDDLVNPLTEFVMIALCCHHRCDWKTFVGKEFFRTENISPKDFAIITKMVSWAICGTGMSRERRRALEQNSLTNDIKPKDASQQLPQEERERIGFICKRVLDFARLDFLRKQGFDCSLKYYVPSDVTLENVCLLARRKVATEQR